jgi:hypothetical protein
MVRRQYATRLTLTAPDPASLSLLDGLGGGSASIFAYMRRTRGR